MRSRNPDPGRAALAALRRALTRTAAVMAAVLVCGTADAGAQELRPLPGSEVILRGGTTMGPWRCRAGGAVAQLAGDASAAPEDALAGVVVRLPLASVDCPSAGMESDLRAALGADRHPHIVLRSLRVANARDGTASVSATLDVAGVARTVSAPVRWTVEGTRLRVTGSLALRMSDFGVEPPRAMLGLVRVRDEVLIEYDVEVSVPTTPQRTGLHALKP